MAQARSQTKGGLTAIHIWMIGFVTLWLVTTVLLVWLYTDQESLRNDLTALRAENGKLVRGGDKSLPWFQQASESGPSMASLCEDARKRTAVLAIGEEAGDVASVEAKVKALLDPVVSDNLVPDKTVYTTYALGPAMDVLYGQYKGLHQQHAALEAQNAELTQKFEDALEEKEALKVTFDADAEALKARVAELEAAHAEYASARDAEVDGFERQMDESRQQASRDLQQKTNQLREEMQRLDDLAGRHEELQAKLGELQIKPGERSTARQPDGFVLHAELADNVAYINLGSRNRLTTGLQFAVYPASGIPTDGSSKGRIEVTRVSDAYAQCRIVSVDPLEVVLEGDLVANPIYDPGRPLNFIVVGGFDLNRDGTEDADGPVHVQSLVKNWGGQILGALSSEVDFVVAGVAPRIPAPTLGLKPGGTRDPDAAEREKMYQRRLDDYNAVLASAAQLSIPVLTQDVFLKFLGY